MLQTLGLRTETRRKERKLVEEGYENEYLTKSEFVAMDSTTNGAGKFYQKTKNIQHLRPPLNALS